MSESKFQRYLRIAEHIIAAYAVWKFIRAVAKTGPKAFAEKLVISIVKAAPGGAAAIAREQQKTIQEIREFTESSNVSEFDEFGKVSIIPQRGYEVDDLLEKMKKLRGAEKEYRDGKAFGGIYYDGKELKEGINQAYCAFADSNGLYPGIFPALRKFELETVRMCASLLHGDEETTGCQTTGGTESIIMSLKAYRERGRSMGITEPEAIVPCTAHAAFAKGCEFFSIKFVEAKILPDGKVDMDDVRSKINRNTVCLVGSAPQFAHGVVDPIEELGQLAQEHNIGLHVDCCLGGFLLPFLEKLGYLRPDCQYDFRVPGVTSMSTDIHKYGYGPKQSSIVLFRNRKLRKFMFFAWTEWSGGMYASPTVAGSRAGGLISSAWATLMLMGMEGYLKVAEDVYRTYTAIVKGIRAIDGLEVIGEPDGACIAFRCTSGAATKVYKVAAALKEVGGWNCNYLQKPVCCGLQIGSRVGFDAETFLPDLEEAVRRVEENPDSYSGGLTQIYGMAADLGSREVVADLLIGYLDEMYNP